MAAAGAVGMLLLEGWAGDEPAKPKDATSSSLDVAAVTVIKIKMRLVESDEAFQMLTAHLQAVCCVNVKPQMVLAHVYDHGAADQPDFCG